MRGVKSEFKTLDDMFRRENELSDSLSTAVIVASYQKAASQNPRAAELARRRYRKHEHRLTTCRDMFISEPHYYRLLATFLNIAKSEHEHN